MGRKLSAAVLAALLAVAILSFAVQEEPKHSLHNVEPENYRYAEAERCINCKQSNNDIMSRAVGIDIESGEPAVDQRGWLGGVHSRSLSHEGEIKTDCAWCHAPTTEGVTQDKEAGQPIPGGDWQGVTCTSCHPGLLKREERESLLANFKPGSDPEQKDSYIFIDKSAGGNFDAQCRYCHHDSHDIIVEAMSEMVASGELRCIDCHMAGYGTDGKDTVERFHNIKVAANVPYSCSGEYGTAVACHADATVEWMNAEISGIKGERKEW